MMVDALLFIATIIIFLDYMQKSFVTKDPEDPETKKWIAEIEAEKRRDKFYGKKRDNED
jgi:hypothetical protein|tara:strand:+ start:145 stop:321 length:177 start_codon:yes stop_codon:yes gene_type:complete